MSSDKLNLIKNYKFTPENLIVFENALKGLYDKPVETDVDPSGKVKISQEYQMQKLIDIGLLALEMNIASMKHSLAMNIEHTLNEEITKDSLDELMKEAMSKFGIDKDKYKSMFGGT